MQVESPKVAIPPLSLPVDREVRRVKPIKWWAGFGIAYVLMTVYIIGRWLTSGDLEPSPVGADEVPWYTLAWIRTIEIFSIPAMFLVIWHWGIKPWRREGRIPLDLLLIIGCILCALQDPLMNYQQLNFIYNGHHINFGSWLGSMPGVLQPNSHLYPEPILAWMPSYVWALFAPSVLGCYLVRRFKRRWPEMGNAGLMSVMFGFWFMFDLILEPTLFVFTQVWSYPGVIRALSLFPGTKYQFPIYESLAMASLYTGATALRYYVDDKGHTVVERGVNTLGVSTRAKTALRGFAITGALGMIFFVTYNLPFQWLSVHVDSYPKDMPSYMLNGICGPGTEYPCPGPDVPIFRPGSKPPILPPPAE